MAWERARKVQGIVVLALSVPPSPLFESKPWGRKQSWKKFLVSLHFASGEVKREDTEILSRGEAYFKIPDKNTFSYSIFFCFFCWLIYSSEAQKERNKVWWCYLARACTTQIFTKHKQEAERQHYSRLTILTEINIKTYNWYINYL